jgi:hypothetical protein
VIPLVAFTSTGEQPKNSAIADYSRLQIIVMLDPIDIINRPVTFA